MPPQQHTLDMALLCDVLHNGWEGKRWASGTTVHFHQMNAKEDAAEVFIIIIIFVVCLFRTAGHLSEQRESLRLSSSSLKSAAVANKGTNRRQRGRPADRLPALYAVQWLLHHWPSQTCVAATWSVGSETKPEKKRKKMNEVLVWVRDILKVRQILADSSVP